MYSIEIESPDGELHIHGETFDYLVEAKNAASQLESNDVNIEFAIVIVTETGERVS